MPITFNSSTPSSASLPHRLALGFLVFFAAIGVFSTVKFFLTPAKQEIPPIQKPLKLVADPVSDTRTSTDDEIKLEAAKQEEEVLVKAKNYIKMRGTRYLDTVMDYEDLEVKRDTNGDFGGREYLLAKGVAVNKRKGSKQEFTAVLRYDAFYESFNFEVVEIDGVVVLMNQDVRENLKKKGY